MGQARGLSEPFIRFGAFAGVFLAMALWELWAPRRLQAISRLRRWPGNLGLSVINTVALRILFPAAAVGAAIFAEAHGWGLLQVINAPDAVAIFVSVILLDLVIYLQHRLFHAVPLLRRLHRVHHADLEYDVTTGVRFHPFEIVLSMVTLPTQVDLELAEHAQHVYKHLARRRVCTFRPRLVLTR